MKKANTTLASYLNYVSDEGLNLDRFVEHGGRMLGPTDEAGLTAGLDDLREKISGLRDEHPQLARQLELLLGYFETNPWSPPEKVRNETIFALLYAAKDTDLMPDDMPEVGYLDDAVVAESVLTRHAETFERYCAAKDIDWAELKPATAN
ncbi:MAG: hypothetical protein RL693_837 [Verrucomicrobiota bacterium]|jgi:uncharacterized membrane protein YkvA (DUF1232 family)